MPVHSKSFYNDVNQVINSAYMPRQQVVQEAKMCPTEVLAIITRAMETGQDNLKKQARSENQKVADPKMRQALDDLMDACPKFPALEEETPDKEGEGNEKVEGGEAKPDF